MATAFPYMHIASACELLNSQQGPVTSSANVPAAWQVHHKAYSAVAQVDN